MTATSLLRLWRGRLHIRLTVSAGLCKLQASGIVWVVREQHQRCLEGRSDNGNVEVKAGVEQLATVDSGENRPRWRQAIAELVQLGSNARVPQDYAGLRPQTTAHRINELRWSSHRHNGQR